MNIEPLLYWAVQRENIRIARATGKPRELWTHDPILAQYRFCNVRREDDRVTVWIRENIREPYANNPNLWFMLLMARMINWPPTLKYLMGHRFCWPITHYDWMQVYHALTDLKNAGEKVWTGAYIIKSDSRKEAAGTVMVQKAYYVAKTVLQEAWLQRHNIVTQFKNGMEVTHKELLKLHGIGPFIGYQAVVDMRFTRILEDAHDKEFWAAAGPGTIRGLNRLNSRTINYPLSQTAACEEMRQIYVPLKRIVPKADFSDVPNVLCETDKMLRVRNNEGRPRSTYTSQEGLY